MALSEPLEVVVEGHTEVTLKGLPEVSYGDVDTTDGGYVIAVVVLDTPVVESPLCERFDHRFDSPVRRHSRSSPWG